MKAAALLTILALSGCTGRREEPSALPASSALGPPQPPAGEPKILHFYAYPAAIVRGQATRLCYGVESVVRARIDPQPGDVPAFANRCLEISPDRTTEFVLSAAGAGGSRVSKNLKVAVTANQARRLEPPAAPEGPSPPRIVSFTVSHREISREGAVTLCYETVDSTSVRIEPPVVDFRLPARGCFGHAPEATTNYRLTATGPGGSDTREVSVAVR